MTRHNTLIIVALTVTWIAGCMTGQDPSEDPEALQEALEQDNGGLDTEDEAPAFGDEETFAADGLEGEDQAVADPDLAYGPDGSTATGQEDDPNAVSVLLLWGQLRFDREVVLPTVWDGSVEVDAGAMVVRRIVRFEGPTDELLPRPDRRTVPFRSATLPHNDGLIVTLLADVDDSSTGAMPALTLRSAALNEDVVIPIADLADGFHARIAVDDLGNELLITTAPRHPCPRGLLAGVWKKVRPGLGTFHGRWMGVGGAVHGHLRGIYGVNRNGQQVFFGKYIGNHGRFRGLLVGTYGDNELRGIIRNRAGETIGFLGGGYTDLDSRLPGDGVFAGHWATFCPERNECPTGERCAAPAEGEL